MKILKRRNKKIEEWVSKRLRKYNNEKSLNHRQYRKHGAIKYIYLVETIKGKKIGVLIAKYYWKNMKIEDLYVNAEYRHQKIGSKLLNTAIEFAKKNKLEFIFLETYSFQDFDFYSKFGFKKVGELIDYPPGEVYYTLRLDLV